MFKRVLYPTDFSECAHIAIPYLKKLKEAGTKELIILHVIDIRQISIMDNSTFLNEGLPLNYDLTDILKKQADKNMSRIIKIFEKIYKVIPIITEGLPFKEILKISEEKKVNLIVLGSHGKSNIEEMLLGSVSEKVARKSKVPCLIIKRKK